MQRINKEDIDKLTNEALNENRNRLTNYFKLAQTLPKYSPNNIALINGQTNGMATLVMSFNDWKNEGVFVNKGEKAIKIFLPSKVRQVEEPSTENVTEAVIPKGTVVYEGTAGAQSLTDSFCNVIGTLPGGGAQIYIPKVDAKWFN